MRLTSFAGLDKISSKKSWPDNGKISHHSLKKVELSIYHDELNVQMGNPMPYD